MRIYLKKFGTVLSSRQMGKESYAALLPSLQELSKGEKIEVDFEGVSSFAPSWGDEFLHPLMETYSERVTFLNTQNPSVFETLKFLESISDMRFTLGS